MISSWRRKWMVCLRIPRFADRWQHHAMCTSFDFMWIEIRQSDPKRCQVSSLLYFFFWIFGYHVLGHWYACVCVCLCNGMHSRRFIFSIYFLWHCCEWLTIMLHSIIRVASQVPQINRLFFSRVESVFYLCA